MIQVSNISKSYGEQKAVHEVSFDIGEGEIVGFLGPNGAGKSTTMKILAGTLAPDSGSVLMFGKDFSQFPIECKRKIGYLPEDNPLYGTMYVREYLEYAAAFYLPKGDIRNAVDEMVETCGLQKEYHKKIETLSKGNRQRVGLAQALIHKPDFLILDEPTAGLDPNQQEEILQAIQSYSAGKQILLSTHSLQEAQKICSRILIIHEGKIRAYEKSEAIESIEEMFFGLTK
jgi:ABC-2 type transport system ATP-binding protein